MQKRKGNLIKNMIINILHYINVIDVIHLYSVAGIALFSVVVCVFLFTLNTEPEKQKDNGFYELPKISTNKDIKREKQFSHDLNKESLISFKDFFLENEDYDKRQYASWSKEEREKRIEKRKKLAIEKFEDLDLNRVDLKKMIKNSYFYSRKNENKKELIVADLNGNISYYKTYGLNSIGDVSLKIKINETENESMLYKYQKKDDLESLQESFDYLIVENESNAYLKGNNINNYSWKKTANAV